MEPIDYGIHVTLSVFLMVGGYQFYFWCQRRRLVPVRELKLAVDDWIPYRPGWVWIYSFLYYPPILYTSLVVDSPRDFTRLATSYFLLLALQMVFFLLFPVATPEHWRTADPRGGWSERLLALVYRFDERTNSFPSMHTSVATLTALHLHERFGGWVFAFPLLIGLSCLFTKQHYLLDVPAGAVLGWTCFEIFRVLE